MSSRTLSITLILLLAALLRLTALGDAPPGMTHDEADHALDAWGVVNGVRPIYFATAYGREPLFDYASAGLMSFLGPVILAGRLTAALFSMLLLAATYTWSKLAFNRRVALLCSAGLAVNFWALMTARHALRSVTMPALLVLALALFWLAIERSERNVRWVQWLAGGLLLGAGFYSYMPARITWLLLPALLLYWALFDRLRLQRHWRPLLLSVLLALVVALPLFIYLSTSGAEARLAQLSGPLERARAGDFSSLIDNAAGSLRLFTVRGEDGPVTWRYNIPGRPLLSLPLGILFYAGLLLAVWTALRGKGRRATGAAFALMWLVAGFAPALITGPDASTTRAIGMQPVLFLFPALALEAGGGWLLRRRLPGAAIIAWLLPVALFSLIAIDSARSYFVVWANHPEVRVHYETTRIAALEWIDANATGAVALSSPTPDRFHDPSLALVTLHNPDVALRWFNGAHALLLPAAAESTLLFSGWAELAPALQRYANFEAALTLPLAATDRDRPLTIVRADTAALAQRLQRERFVAVEPVRFGESLTLLGYDLVVAQGRLQLATLWRIEQPIEGLKLFTHLLAGPQQPPLAQADRLDAPSDYWWAGDHLIQLHEFDVAAVEAGRYLLTVGAYREPQPGMFARLPARQGDKTLGDSATITEVTLP